MDMKVYLFRRLLQGVLTLFLVSIVIFVILRVAPGDVADLIITGGDGSSTGATSQEREELRQTLGLDRSLLRQYVEWSWDMATLSWGESLFTGRSVWDDFFRKLPVTLQLSLMGLFIAVALGVPLGVAAALKQDTWMDYLARIFALGGVSLPHFWLATLLLIAGVRYFTWSPPLGYESVIDAPWRNITQFIWPALVLGYSGAGLLSRMTRSAVLEVMRQEYIRTAMAKGLQTRAIMGRHTLRNALLPVITVIGIAFAALVSGSVVLEQVFVLPGVGLFLLEAVKFRDYTVVQPIIVFFAAWVVLVNMTVDVIYTWLNPQVRHG
jgi:peptide/nickel transport system permease protein